MQINNHFFAVIFYNIFFDATKFIHFFGLRMVNSCSPSVLQLLSSDNTENQPIAA